MALTAAGLNFLCQATIGQGTPFNASNAYLGVGNGDDLFDAAQTNLQGSQKFRGVMDAGYPKVDGNVVMFKTTFGQSDANFPWLEWGVFNALSGGVMLNRVVESNGTKQSNQTWTLEVAITFAIGT